MLQLVFFALFLGLGVSAQQSAWGQCGGSSWTGASACVAGYTCYTVNVYYAQCTPGTATTTAATSATTTPTGTGSKTTSTVLVTSTASATSPPTTLASGWLWIRAVESPNFHSYLQAAPTATPSPGPGAAYLGSYTSAGQFNVIDGQLVYNTGSGQLYMNVEDPTDKTQRTLETWFNTTENTYGTFSFSGDALEWSVSDINRPNLAAWYVCGTAGQLYINTGAYAYDNPTGCVDETIHYYNGATATLRRRTPWDY